MSGNIYTRAIGTLNPGQTGSITLSGTVMASTPNGTIIVNTGSILGSGNETNT